MLAINPRNYEALLGAGRASLKLGDPQAAIGFFGRAEEVSPSHWAAKAGQASALAQMGEATAALGMFGEAQRLGATQTLIALDRGLAFDLLARQTEAQNDYRSVLSGAEQDEARRRLALSLGISGRKAEALTLLDPLLARRDPAARRARAFILALGGDLEGARVAIGAMMPGSAGGFDPFLRRLPTLGPGQKAAAVHLGMMPAEGAALAQVEPEPPLGPPVRVAAVQPEPVRVEPRPNAARLADVETILVQLPSPPAAATKLPPAPKPKVEKAKRPAPENPFEITGRLGTSSKASRTKLAKADEKLGKADPKQDKKDAETKPAKPGASRVYVQLAGGANAERMGGEFARIKAKKASLFRNRQPVVSEVKGWSRLLVGPFADPASAQDFVNDLHAAKLEGFVWTAPSGTKLEKLAAK